MKYDMKISNNSFHLSLNNNDKCLFQTIEENNIKIREGK